MLVNSGHFVGPGTLIDQREVEGGLGGQVEALLAFDHRLRVQGLLVVVHGRWNEPQLVHGSAQVVVTLLEAKEARIIN